MKGLIEIKNHISFQKLKTLKEYFLNIRIATVVIASGCILCMSFFMNCSSTDSPISKPSTNSTPTTQGSSGGGGGTTVSTTTTFYTNPNPGETPVVGGSSSNIVWLHTDVSSWEKTSEITKVEIKENGEVCIEHSKSGQWEAKSIADPNSNTDPSSSDSVEGNAWILVPIRDAFYAGIYDYLIAGEACHTLDAGSIANLYNSDKSLGRRVDKNPLKSWVAQAEDTIYFMVSGLAKDGKSNVEERSNIVKIDLPSRGGEVPIIPPCSEDPTGPHCPGQCNIPDRSSVIGDIADDDPDALQAGHQLNLNRAGNGAQSADDSRWEFMDEVVKDLNEQDPRWGYICVEGDCEDISTDTIGYLCDDSDTGTVPIDIIDANGNVQWDVNEAGEDTWKFPREEEPNKPVVTVDNDVSDFSWDKVRWLNSHNVSCWPEASNITSVDIKQSGQICIDHSKKGQWPEAIPLESTVLEGNPYIIVKINGVYYAATYEWLRPGQVCKLGFSGPLSITYAGKDSLGKHTKRHPLQDWEPKGGEVIGFMVSGLARLQVTPNAVERSQIIWYKLPSVGDSIQGEQVGSYSGIAGVGNGCKLDGFEESEVGNTAACSEVPNRLDIVNLVGAATEDIYKTDANQFTERVVECLKDIDSNWGRYRNKNNNISPDKVAYRLSGSSDPCGIDIVVNHSTSNAVLSWQTPTQYEGTAWLSVAGSCVVDILPCTPEQNEDGFLTIDGVCTPLCARLGFSDKDDNSLDNISEEYYDLYGEVLKHVEVNEGDACDPENSENEEYNILPITIKTAFVTSVTSETPSNSCCRRSKKKDCSAVAPHYSSKTVGSEEGCYPSCGQAAVLAGYDANNHIQSDLNTTCNASTIDGQHAVGTWKTIPNFYDPYNFKVLDSMKVVTDTGHLCCVKGSPSHEPALEHNEDGTYDVIAGTPVSTTTTTSNNNNGCSPGCDSGLVCRNGVCVAPAL